MALFYAIMLYYAAEPQIRKEVFSWTTPYAVSFCFSFC